MEITKKVFWREAMLGGTIIGLTGIGFALMKYAATFADSRFWGGLLLAADLVVFISLIYAFTRKIGLAADKARGFSYNRSLGFVLAMMLFYGFLMGVYTAIFNNFINPEGAMRSVDEVMAIMQDALPDDQFDSYYLALKAGAFNPLTIVFSSMLNGVIGGLIIGLITSAFTKRNPDIFADGNNERSDENSEV